MEQLGVPCVKQGEGFCYFDCNVFYFVSILVQEWVGGLNGKFHFDVLCDKLGMDVAPKKNNLTYSISEIRCLSKKNFNTSDSKKAWSFMKNKLHHVCFGI